MPLIVENGAMPEGANVYASLADADAYLIPRGLWPVTGVLVDTDAGTETPDAEMVLKKSAALLRASDYLNAIPGGKWESYPVDPGWHMAWPRVAYSNIVEDMEDDTPYKAYYVPGAVARACMELAALTFGGVNLMQVRERGGMIASESHSEAKGGVDVIGGDSVSDSYTYSQSAPADTYYPQLAGIEPYLAVVPGRAKGVRVLDVVRA